MSNILLLAKKHFDHNDYNCFWQLIEKLYFSEKLQFLTLMEKLIMLTVEGKIEGIDKKLDTVIANQNNQAAQVDLTPVLAALADIQAQLTTSGTPDATPTPDSAADASKSTPGFSGSGTAGE